MTEYMGTISGPLPAGANPQGDEVSVLIESLMAIAEAEECEPTAGGNTDEGTWSLTVTVGETHRGWHDAFAELRHLADQLPALATRLELISYDDPLFRD